MTLPDERYRAVEQTRQFLWQLADPDAIAGIPQDVRDLAMSLLRHYPTQLDMGQAAELAPDVFQQEMEPVTRLMAQYYRSRNRLD